MNTPLAGKDRKTNNFSGLHAFNDWFSKTLVIGGQGGNKSHFLKLSITWNCCMFVCCFTVISRHMS